MGCGWKRQPPNSPNDAVPCQAVSPSGSGRPLTRQQAVSVLDQKASDGHRPPAAGHRRDRARTLGTAVVMAIAHQPVFAGSSGWGTAVDAPRRSPSRCFTQSPGIISGRPTAAHKEYRPAAGLGQVLRREWAMVTVQSCPPNSNCAIGLPTMFRPPPRPPPTRQLRDVAQRHQAAQGRAGHNRLLTGPKKAHVRDVEPVDILGGSIVLMTLRHRSDPAAATARVCRGPPDRQSGWRPSRGISASASLTSSLCSKLAMPDLDGLLPLLRT